MHKIFSYFISSSMDSETARAKKAAYASWFTDQFPETEFKQEERLMFSAIKYAAKFDTSLSERGLEIYIQTDGMNEIISNKIMLDGTEDLFDFSDMAKLESLKVRSAELMLLHFNQAIDTTLNIDDFAMEVRQFIDDRLSIRMQEVLATAYEMQTSPVKGSYGAVEASKYVLEEMSRVQEIYDITKLEDLESSELESGFFEFVSDTGIPDLDRDMRGIRRKQLIGVEADAGTGKTKFSTGVIAYRAVVNYKRNVLYFAIEQDSKEVEANMVARHVLSLYNIVVSHMDVLVRDLPQEILDKIDAARIDLFESGKYGRFKCVTGEVKLESMNTLMKRKMKLDGGYDIIIIDYIALIEQEDTKGKYQKKLEEYQIIRAAYRKFKKFCRLNNIAGIAINQLNDKGAEKAKKGQDLSTSDAQGGREVYKSPDYNITLTATVAMQERELREIQNVKRRNSAGFGRILLQTKMACCYFAQKKGEKL